MDILIEHARTKGAKESLIRSFYDNEIDTTPLMFATQFDDIELPQKLIKAGADVNEQKGGDSSFALHQATCNNNLKLVKLLIENGADVNMETNTGDSALIWAVAKENYEITKLLLENNAKINQKIMNKFEDIMLNAILADKRIAKILLDNVEDEKLKERWNYVYDH